MNAINSSASQSVSIPTRPDASLAVSPLSYIETTEEERDEVLYYLLAAHPGVLRPPDQPGLIYLQGGCDDVFPLYLLLRGPPI
eukprot:scaffold272363_cov42-Prasinocladus_malaysianus.AAC.1